MRECSANSSKAGSSSKEMSRSIALSPKARYMAPLSRVAYPSLRASREAIVLFPAPAGPSMAMMSLRGSFILNGRFYTSGAEDRIALCPRSFSADRDARAARIGSRRTVGGFRPFRRNLDVGTISNADKAQFPGRQQRINCFFHARTRNQVRKEALDFGRFRGDDAIQIF